MDFLEKGRNIPVCGKWDVVVCGGGPSGFIAAIAAARSGCSTLLIERYGFLGGMATAGLVAPISEFNKEKQRVIDGIPYEFISRLHAIGGAVTSYENGNIPFDDEKYKLIAQRMVLEAGAQILFHTIVADCITEDSQGKKVTHIIVENKSGRQAVMCDTVVDCTGDADVCRRAGFETKKADELQPMSLWFHLGNVDSEKLDERIMDIENGRFADERIAKKLRELAETQEVPLFGGPWFEWYFVDRQVSINMLRCAGDGSNAFEQSRVECRMREDLFKMVEVLKNNFDEFKDCYIVKSGCQTGVRETYRITGNYEMTIKDILEPVDFSDTVCKGAHVIDIHSSKDTNQELVAFKKAYNIPLRALIPKDSINMIVAGRCASADRHAFATMRVQACCMGMGQAAGTAAALAVKTAAAICNIDVGKLRNLLREQNAIID
ncbi:FAD dependent oxidoreductase [Ruminiclostridium sufflavum DSM 19573]|uniref:FAD dependent oxidoreductase n=1 Tax=Ruminiclostridium sufflavum DSM 19573 TaxID=1121337 RepID=A0A318XIL1_9FIRM|nr:FAD-dependent oxidoreductase [Ruminiclostridium sufflavum]PYG85761.1 FAD dependent oxidoreductase [Ruminiclostridium sufflavum DSM 19573]